MTSKGLLGLYKIRGHDQRKWMDKLVLQELLSYNTSSIVYAPHRKNVVRAVKGKTFHSRDTKWLNCHFNTRNLLLWSFLYCNSC